MSEVNNVTTEDTTVPFSQSDFGIPPYIYTVTNPLELSVYDRVTFLIKALELEQPHVEKRSGVIESEDEFFMVHEPVFSGKQREALKEKLFSLLLD